MGFPSEGTESVYRNPMSEVQRFFVTKHGFEHYKVYNLCSERDYDDVKFTEHGGEVARYPFKDHNVPSIEMIHQFCKDVHEFLSRDEQNIVAIHCKAGKGRTGVMISSYLFYCHICDNAEESLRKYGEARTHNAKGVTIPSQARFVYYYEKYILSREMTDLHEIVLCKKIRLNSVPNFDLGGGCDPYFIILDLRGQIIYDYSQFHEILKRRNDEKNDGSSSSPAVIEFDDLNIILTREVKFVFYDKDLLTSDDVMCWCWLHTSFLDDISDGNEGYGVHDKYTFLERGDIDGAVKDKRRQRFDDNFSIEFWFDLPLQSEERGVRHHHHGGGGGLHGDGDDDDENNDSSMDEHSYGEHQGVFLHNAEKRKSALV